MAWVVSYRTLCEISKITNATKLFTIKILVNLVWFLVFMLRCSEILQEICDKKIFNQLKNVCHYSEKSSFYHKIGRKMISRFVFLSSRTQQDIYL